MTVTEKVAYIKGLVDGLDLDAKKDEVKVIKAIIELLDDMAMSVSDLEEGLDVVSDQVDEIDEDLSDLEGCVYEDDDDCCCGDDECYEIECPSCGETICVDDGILEDGSIDCLWGCFTMTGREDRYQWTSPYLYSWQMVVVRADSSISSLSELRDKRIAVQATSKPEEIFLEGSNKHIPTPEMVYSFSTMDEVYACLRKGYADAICGHESALDSLIRTSPADYRKLRESVYKSEIGVEFSKDYNRGFVDRLSETLTEMRNDGTIADIAEKYSMDKDVLPEVTGK